MQIAKLDAAELEYEVAGSGEPLLQEEIMNVRFGSLAAVDNLTTLMTAFGCIVDVRFEQKPMPVLC